MFCTIYFVQRKNFLIHVLYRSVQCIKYTFRIYILYISKNITSYTIFLVFKIVESLHYILNYNLVEKYFFCILRTGSLFSKLCSSWQIKFFNSSSLSPRLFNFFKCVEAPPKRFRVCGLRLGFNFVWPAADKIFHLQLMLEKMHAFVVSKLKYL